MIRSHTERYMFFILYLGQAVNSLLLPGRGYEAVGTRRLQPLVRAYCVYNADYTVEYVRHLLLS
jgi:hypothetical protein